MESGCFGGDVLGDVNLQCKYHGNHDDPNNQHIAELPEEPKRRAQLAQEWKQEGCRRGVQKPGLDIQADARGSKLPGLHPRACNISWET